MFLQFKPFVVDENLAQFNAVDHLHGYLNLLAHQSVVQQLVITLRADSID